MYHLEQLFFLFRISQGLLGTRDKRRGNLRSYRRGIWGTLLYRAYALRKASWGLKAGKGKIERTSRVLGQRRDLVLVDPNTHRHVGSWGPSCIVACKDRSIVVVWSVAAGVHVFDILFSRDS